MHLPITNIILDRFTELRFCIQLNPKTGNFRDFCPANHLACHSTEVNKPNTTKAHPPTNLKISQQKVNVKPNKFWSLPWVKHSVTSVCLSTL